jgi:N-acetylneuraminate synthase/N,N'-diacetyllegionaminate synthase
MKSRCFIIAEAGVNHNGDPDLARQLVDAAADAGADCVKFQTFSAARVVSREARKAEYQQRTSGAAESQFDMLRRLELPREAHRELLERCQQRGIEFLSTPFDEGAADFLAELGVRRFKIPSGELTNHRFLRHIAAKGLPIICSTGMATLGEVEAALAAIESGGRCEVTLLHCVSNYPAAPETSNLRAMETMARAFGVPVGFSDHTMGIAVSTAAVALGATVIEKHLTLDRSLPGPDHAASALPEEFTALTDAIRQVEAAMGDGRKRPAASEAEVAQVARRSLVAACDIAAGAILSEEMLTTRRPADGLPPFWSEQLIGRRARRPIAAGAVISLEMFGS